MRSCFFETKEGCSMQQEEEGTCKNAAAGRPLTSWMPTAQAFGFVVSVLVVLEVLVVGTRWIHLDLDAAQLMGEAGSGFAADELSMDYMYDYMLHVLTKYAKLLRYKPRIPEKATELCPESMACPAKGLDRTFMMESMERYTADHDQCVLPSPFTTEEVRKTAERAEAVRSKIEKMEKTVDRNAG